ncbi:MAG: ATP-binding protein [Asticcacaulis sp.]
MASFPIPENEQARLDVVRALERLEVRKSLSLDRVPRLARALIQCDNAAVILIDEATCRILAQTGQGPTEIPRPACIAAWAVMAPEDVIWIEDLRDEPNLVPPDFYLDSKNVAFVAAAPLRVGGQVIGTLSVMDGQPIAYSRELADRLQDMAGLLSDEITLLATKKGLDKALVDSRAKTEMLRTFLQDAPVGLAMFDTHLNLVRASQRWTEDLRLRPDEILGRSADTLLAHLPGEWTQALRGSLIEETVKKSLIPYTDASGLTVWLKWECRPWYTDTAKLGGIVMMTENISADIETHQKSVANEARLQLAVDIADITIWEYEYKSKQLKQYEHGSNRAVMPPKEYEIIFDHFILSLHPDDRERVSQAWQAHVEHGTPYRCEYRQFNRQGDLAWIQASAILERDTDDRPIRIIGVLRDITERKQMELNAQRDRNAAEAANTAKSAFLANMSHEIRTPLNGVLGIAGALKRTRLDQQQTEMVDLIEVSSRTLTRLLGDILDIARIEAGRLTVVQESFNPAKLLTQTALLFQDKVTEKGLTLETDIDEILNDNRMGDDLRLRQIISNLLNNAIKFTQQGRILISARADSDDWVTIQVMDTGIGFDAETKARLFTRFQQADDSITRRFGGTGLGLSISRSLAEMMGGTITADAVPEIGATFTVRLPLPRSERQPVLGPSNRPTPIARDLAAEDLTDWTTKSRPPRILLAEDHPANRRVVELILDGAGLELIAVENGALAVEAFKQEAFDLVLMDMQMPVMDGLTAIQEIRRYETETHQPHTPIYVLTANAMPEDERRSRAAGADAHLTKPLAADVLLRAVLNALEPEDDLVVIDPDVAA